MDRSLLVFLASGLAIERSFTGGLTAAATLHVWFSGYGVVGYRVRTCGWSGLVYWSGLVWYAWSVFYTRPLDFSYTYNLNEPAII